MKEQEKKQQEYEKYVKEVTPTHNIWMQMVRAFITGGCICTIGQVIINVAMNYFALEQKEAASWCSLILIFLAILLTGLNVYPSITKWGGAGSLVPITGFANSVAAPAIEFKKEGQVFGVGCKIFTIAGPVILYGIFSSGILGFIYYLLKVFKLM
ncbi:stage V sporulation protein AC [Lachnospiraceae bacterium OttesenSCG-928-D06]|nr:stage V sporulation protein AC [Lachnospiraceae bacterium OttesenSCG-928-D06]